MSTIPPIPKQFSAEIINTSGRRTLVHVDGWMRRVETQFPDGSSAIVISRPDKGVIWSLTPQTRTFSQTKLPKWLERVFNPDTLYDWSEEGVDMIDGRRCLRFVGRHRNPDRPVGDSHVVCFVDALTKMRRREVGLDMKGKPLGMTEYLNAVVGPQPPEVFEMPDGYKRAYHKRK